MSYRPPHEWIPVALYLGDLHLGEREQGSQGEGGEVVHPARDVDCDI